MQNIDKYQSDSRQNKYKDDVGESHETFVNEDYLGLFYSLVLF